MEEAVDINKIIIIGIYNDNGIGIYKYSDGLYSELLYSCGNKSFDKPDIVSDKGAILVEILKEHCEKQTKSISESLGVNEMEVYYGNF